MDRNKLIITAIISIGLLSLNSNCSKSKSASPLPDPAPPVVVPGTITSWITKGDKSLLLQKQGSLLAFNSPVNTNPTVQLHTKPLMVLDIL
jgi:glucosylceramidase